MKRLVGFATLAATSIVMTWLSACSDSTNPSSPDAGGGTLPDATANDSAIPSLDAGADAASGVIPVSIQFKAKVGSSDFQCGTTYNTQGATAESVQPSDLRFFVDKVYLVNDKGMEVPVTFDERTPWQTKDVALLDFEDGKGECKNGNAETNSRITGTVPAGTYRGIVFSNGVPESLNHGDPTKAPAPLQAGGMTWGWLYGYKFFTAQLVSMSLPDGGADAGARGIGLFHLGSVGCDNAVDGGDPDFNQPPKVTCTQANRNRIKLSDFSPTNSAVVLDVGALFSATDLKADSQCHSAGDACPPLFTNIGLSFQTGAQLPSQSVYRTE